jgi:hypothetical protein
MSCAAVRRRLSALRDGELEGARAAALRAHLEACVECGVHWRSLSDALDCLAQAPRIDPPESLATQVLNRLELERRGPGLALLFRSWWAARPLIFPSLVPAAAVVLAILGSAVLLDRPVPLPDVYVRPGTAAGEAAFAPGTEQNPFLAGTGVAAPQGRGLALPAEVLAQLADGTFFLETVVARDGTVAGVRLIEGDANDARELVKALRRQRFEPARYQGRPVAVSVYRLISRMEVRAPIT